MANILKKGQWRTRQGKLLRICKMDENHLQAVREWLSRVLVSHIRKMKMFSFGLEENFFFDNDDGWELEFLRMLMYQSWLEDKLAEFDKEIAKRQSPLYRMTHRKRQEPRATLMTDRQILVRF